MSGCRSGREQMVITVGLGSLDDYLPFVRAGAGELFAGYVPLWWREQVGERSPLNRREVSYYNVQLGSRSELQILSALQERCGVPVTITFNSPFYDPDTYPLIRRAMAECVAEGFSSFTVADPGLLLYLAEEREKEGERVGKGHRAARKPLRLQLSGEAGEISRFSLGLAQELGVLRVIFPRRCTPEQMGEILSAVPMEGEAFVLNELCHFSGAYCNTLHGDVLAPICRVPYRLGEVEDGGESSGEAASSVTDPPGRMDLPVSGSSDRSGSDAGESWWEAGTFPGVGGSGCGLCALPALRRAGVRALKVVSRGNATEETLRDIRALSRALELLEVSSSEEEYFLRLREEFFPAGCSGRCYYLPEGRHAQALWKREKRQGS